jgi:hypothetical protein
VDHAAPSPADLVRPWRTATLVLTGIAALELVLLVGAGAVLLGRRLAPHVGAADGQRAVAHPKSKPTPPIVPKRQPIGVPKLTRRETAVIVLNGNGQTGAAGAEAEVVRAHRYRVAHVGNAGRRDYARSLVIYRPGFRAEGFRLGHDLGIRIVTPLDGMRARALGRAQLAVVVGD